MLLGRVQAGVCWLSEKSRARVLHLSEAVEMKSFNGSDLKLLVFNLLGQKRPDPVIPPQSALVIALIGPRLRMLNVQITIF